MDFFNIFIAEKPVDRTFVRQTGGLKIQGKARPLDSPDKAGMSWKKLFLDKFCLVTYHEVSLTRNVLHVL